MAESCEKDYEPLIPYNNFKPICKLSTVQKSGFAICVFKQGVEYL
jgi:hypothetical protein